MIQCDCNIEVVSLIQLVVNKNFFHLQFFDLIVKKYNINNIPKCTPFWHEMFKIASVSGGAYDAPPDPLVVKGFFPTAITALCLRPLHFPRFAFLSMQKTQKLSHYLKSLKYALL